MEHPFLIANLSLRRGACTHLDSANPGANAAVAGDQRPTDLTAAFDVSTATQFACPVTEGHHSNQVTVLLVEECHGTRGNRLVERQLLHTAHQVGTDLFIEQAGNPVELI